MTLKRQVNVQALKKFTSVLVRLCLCAVECSGYQQRKWPSNDAAFLRAFGWGDCVWRNVPYLKFFVFMLQINANFSTSYSYISLEVRHVMSHLYRAEI